MNMGIEPPVKRQIQGLLKEADGEARKRKVHETGIRAAVGLFSVGVFFVGEVVGLWLLCGHFHEPLDNLRVNTTAWGELLNQHGDEVGFLLGWQDSIPPRQSDFDLQNRLG